MGDDIEKALTRLKGELPTPRLNLSEEEKDALLLKLGPRTARNVLQARDDYPLSRIPFLFSSLDTQTVVDLLANDMTAALERALSKGKKTSAKGRKL